MKISPRLETNTKRFFISSLLEAVSCKIKEGLSFLQRWDKGCFLGCVNLPPTAAVEPAT